MRISEVSSEAMLLSEEFQSLSVLNFAHRPGCLLSLKGRGSDASVNELRKKTKQTPSD